LKMTSDSNRILFSIWEDYSNKQQIWSWIGNWCEASSLFFSSSFAFLSQNFADCISMFVLCFYS
jgi:hypothetical protein